MPFSKSPAAKWTEATWPSILLTPVKIDLSIDLSIYLFYEYYYYYD